jgi:hypothetical protein
MNDAKKLETCHYGLTVRRTSCYQITNLMKNPSLPTLVAIAVFSGCPRLSAEDAAAPQVMTAPATTVASIPEPISDGSPSPAPPPVEKPDFRIESTQVKRLDVVESPPMPGLPPVEGTITLTVRNVADPGLPDPPPPPQPREIDDPEVKAQLAELRAKHLETHIAFVSATVYDRSRTHLTVYPSGGLDKAITVWSNLDFNHFSGFGSFQATDADGEVRQYALLMGIGNETSGLRRRLLAERGIEYEEPEIPAIPDGTPAFVIETETPDPQSVTLIEDLHALYRAEGARMAEAEVARQKAYEERRAYLLANPPKPKDVTVHFWKRTKGDENTQQKGGQP